jgi:hypothetical protein
MAPKIIGGIGRGRGRGRGGGVPKAAAAAKALPMAKAPAPAWSNLGWLSTTHVAMIQYTDQAGMQTSEVYAKAASFVLGGSSGIPPREFSRPEFTLAQRGPIPGKGLGKGGNLPYLPGSWCANLQVEVVIAPTHLPPAPKAMPIPAPAGVGLVAAAAIAPPGLYIPPPPFHALELEMTDQGISGYIH